MKRILLVTSVYTGSGHKSISDSLVEQFSGMPDVEVMVADGFSFAGKLGVQVSKIYKYTTRDKAATALYNICWKYSNRHPSGYRISACLCRRRFLKCIRLFHPDLILTVHSMLNTVLTEMLKMYHLDIPVVVLQADLVNIHSSWCNSDALVTICPSQEAYQSSIRHGMPPEKLKVMGFPTRRQFCEMASYKDSGEVSHRGRPLRCMLMSGGEGSKELRRYADSILAHTDVNLTIICGKNRMLFRRLQKKLGSKYNGQVKLLGFTENLERVMLDSDVLISRSSPNTIMEAVTMTIPVIMTGPILMQETGTPELMQKYGLGVICSSPEEAPAIIRKLQENNAALLQKIRAAQQSFRSFENAREIAKYVAELAKPLDYIIE